MRVLFKRLHKGLLDILMKDPKADTSWGVCIICKYSRIIRGLARVSRTALGSTRLTSAKMLSRAFHTVNYSNLGKLEGYVTPPLSPTAVRDPTTTVVVNKSLMQYCVMDGDPHRMQYGQTTYPPVRAYAAATAANIRGPSDLDPADRYRRSHAHISSARSPTSIPGTTAGNQNPGFTGYSYAQGGQQYAPQLQGSPLPYQPDFSQDVQRPQQFPSYSSNLMYNLSSQIQQPSAYDSVQQYQPRQSAVLDALTNPLGVPQYYNTGEASSASTAPVLQTYSSAPYQQQQQQQHHQQHQDVSPYQHSSEPTAARTTTESSPYVSGMAGYTQQPSMTNTLGQQQQRNQQYHHQQSRSQSQPQPQPQQDQQQDNLQQGQGMTDEAYAEHLNALKQTFQDVYDGKLPQAAHRLLGLSDSLLGRANELGKQPSFPRPPLYISSTPRISITTPRKIFK